MPFQGSNRYKCSTKTKSPNSFRSLFPVSAHSESFQLQSSYLTIRALQTGATGNPLGSEECIIIDGGGRAERRGLSLSLCSNLSPYWECGRHAQVKTNLVLPVYRLCAVQRLIRCLLTSLRRLHPLDRDISRTAHLRQGNEIRNITSFSRPSID